MAAYFFAGEGGGDVDDDGDIENDSVGKTQLEILIMGAESALLIDLLCKVVLSRGKKVHLRFCVELR